MKLFSLHKKILLIKLKKKKMIIISHRGLINGPNKEKENLIYEIKKNIFKYPSILFEIDIWLKNKKIFIGHELSSSSLDLKELVEFKNKFILHIKYIDNYSKYLIDEIVEQKFHFFCHDNDDFTITSKGWPWIHPKRGIIENTICVLPEQLTDISNLDFIKTKNILGVCTDYPLAFL